MRPLVLALLLPSTALAQYTAIADARDLAVSNDRVLVASEGGLFADGSPIAGLPGARMRSVSATDDGIWVGGVEGTALLDADLRVVRTFPIRRVRRAVRFAGQTWLASFGDGLYRYDGEMHAVSLGTANAYVRLTDLSVRGGELWVASSGVGILRVGADGRVLGRIRERDGLPTDYVWDLAPDGDRTLAATMDGVAEIAADGRVDRSSAIASSARRLPIRDVRAIAIDGGSVYFGTFGSGVWRASNGAPQRVRGPIAEANALLMTEHGLLVAHAGGVHRVDGARVDPVLRGGLPSGDVTALERAFGTTWAGTFGAGLARLRGDRFEPVTEAHDRWRVDRRINDLAITVRPERLWIATDRGLHYFDGRIYSRIDDPNGPGSAHVTALHVDRDGALWAVTTRQVCRFAARWRCWSGDQDHPLAQLHAITTDAQGRVWIGSLHGLYRFDPASERFERHTVSSGALPVDWITALVPWGDGVMAGTYHGGLVISDGAHFRTIAEGEGGLSSGWVNPHAMRRVGDDVWIGTLERGLLIGRPGAWRHLTTSDGLPSDDVTDVLADRDGVWVATRGGIVRLPR